MLDNKRVYWFTGLSGAGKTTIAELVKEKLTQYDQRVAIVDGDVVRATLSKGLGFTREDILLNNQLIANHCRTLLGQYDVLLVPVIAPLEEGRNLASKILGQDVFRLVYFSANLKTVAERDVKNLYKKAFAGEIKNMIGVCESTPYQIPKHFDFEINSGEGHSPEVSARMLEVFINKDRIVKR